MTWKQDSSVLEHFTWELGLPEGAIDRLTPTHRLWPRPSPLHTPLPPPPAPGQPPAQTPSVPCPGLSPASPTLRGPEAIMSAQSLQVFTALALIVRTSLHLLLGEWGPVEQRGGCRQQKSKIKLKQRIQIMQRW